MGELLALSAQPPSETLDRLELQLRLATKAQAAELDLVRHSLHSVGLSSTVTNIFDDELLLDVAPVEAALQQPVRMVVTKLRVAGKELFLTVEGFQGFLQGARRGSLPSLAEVAVEFEPFSSLSTDFMPWQPEVTRELPVRAIQGDAPCRLVRDLSNDLVPGSAACWVYEASPITGGPVWDAFVLAASNILPFALVNEAWRDESGTPNVSLKGDRTVSLHAPPVTAVGYGRHEAFNAAASWVFGKQDADVRHALLTNELAREWRENETWTGVPAE